MNYKKNLFLGSILCASFFASTEIFASPLKNKIDNLISGSGFTVTEEQALTIKSKGLVGNREGTIAYLRSQQGSSSSSSGGITPEEKTRLEEMAVAERKRADQLATQLKDIEDNQNRIKTEKKRTENNRTNHIEFIKEKDRPVLMGLLKENNKKMNSRQAEIKDDSSEEAKSEKLKLFKDIDFNNAFIESLEKAPGSSGSNPSAGGPPPPPPPPVMAKVLSPKEKIEKAIKDEINKNDHPISGILTINNKRKIALEIVEKYVSCFKSDNNNLQKLVSAIEYIGRQDKPDVLEKVINAPFFGCTDRTIGVEEFPTYGLYVATKAKVIIGGGDKEGSNKDTKELKNEIAKKLGKKLPIKEAELEKIKVDISSDLKNIAQGVANLFFEGQNPFDDSIAFDESVLRDNEASSLKKETYSIRNIYIKSKKELFDLKADEVIAVRDGFVKKYYNTLKITEEKTEYLKLIYLQYYIDLIEFIEQRSSLAVQGILLNKDEIKKLETAKEELEKYQNKDVTEKHLDAVKSNIQKFHDENKNNEIIKNSYDKLKSILDQKKQTLNDEKDEIIREFKGEIKKS